MFTRTLKVAAVGGVLLLGLAVSAYSNAWSDPIHRDYVTFSRAVAIPGTVLPAGTYRFEIPLHGQTDLVSVLSRDGHKVYLTQFTQVIDKRNGDNRAVVLGEAAPGTAPQVKAWFPMNGQSGRQFIYN